MLRNQQYCIYVYKKRLYIIALILCIFLVVIGTHRFYSGSLVYGKFLLFTFGGLGNFWIYGVLFITGILKSIACCTQITYILGKNLECHTEKRACFV